MHTSRDILTYPKLALMSSMLTLSFMLPRLPTLVMLVMPLRLPTLGSLALIPLR